MSDFKYLHGKKFDSARTDLTEIAYQLKRIADNLEKK